FAAASVSVSRNAVSRPSFNSTFLIPALAQPSSEPRKPAARAVFWWMLRDIFVVGIDGAGSLGASTELQPTAARGAAAEARAKFLRVIIAAYLGIAARTFPMNSAKADPCIQRVTTTRPFSRST